MQSCSSLMKINDTPFAESQQQRTRLVWERGEAQIPPVTVTAYSPSEGRVKIIEFPPATLPEATSSPLLFLTATSK